MGQQTLEREKPNRVVERYFKSELYCLIGLESAVRMTEIAHLRIFWYGSMLQRGHRVDIVLRPFLKGGKEIV